METWRAAILRNIGSDLDIVRIVRPDLTFGQVLVALDYAGVCRSQLMEVRGLRGPDPWLPHLLGHEGAGVVVEIGTGVSKVKVGDRVIVGWIQGTGLESETPTFRTTKGENVNAGKVTTFSEYTVVCENRVYLQPTQVDNRSAVLFGCALLTGAGMVLNEARPLPGEVLLVNGLGGVGMAALISTVGLEIAVIAADPDPEKRELALNFGARHVFDPFESNLGSQISRHFADGVDVAIDASGTTTGIEAAFESLRYDGGRLVFASHPPADQRICLDPHDLIKGRTIRGSWGGACKPDQDIPKLSSALSAADVNLSFMLPRTYLLDEINEALHDLEAQRVMRPIISMKARTE